MLCVQQTVWQKSRIFSQRAPLHDDERTQFVCERCEGASCCKASALVQFSMSGYDRLESEPCQERVFLVCLLFLDAGTEQDKRSCVIQVLHIVSSLFLLDDIHEDVCSLLLEMSAIVVAYS